LFAELLRLWADVPRPPWRDAWHGMVTAEWLRFGEGSKGSPWTRAAAVRALAAITVSHLRTPGDPFGREREINGKRWSDVAVEAIEQSLKTDENPWVRLNARHGLALIKDARDSVKRGQNAPPKLRLDESAELKSEAEHQAPLDAQKDAR
jgi:hypothetical protein